jgi:hypothetical protein
MEDELTTEMIHSEATYCASQKCKFYISNTDGCKHPFPETLTHSFDRPCSGYTMNTRNNKEASR